MKHHKRMHFLVEDALEAAYAKVFCQAIAETVSPVERLNLLARYFSMFLAQDKQDGTSFDCDVLNTIDALKAKYRRATG